MTPKQMILNEILLDAAAQGLHIDVPVTSENVERLYNELLVEPDDHWDYESNMRGGEVETGLPCEWSRHYEAKSVAAKMANGQWVGWTYWYGGGKHGEPEAIDWMDYAYFLDCKEEEKLVTIRTFTKKEPTSAGCCEGIEK